MTDDTTYSAPGLKIVSLGARGRGVVAERNQLLQVDEDAFLVTHKALLTVDYAMSDTKAITALADTHI